jgi:hypothetical protein
MTGDKAEKNLRNARIGFTYSLQNARRIKTGARTYVKDFTIISDMLKTMLNFGIVSK